MRAIVYSVSQRDGVELLEVMEWAQESGRDAPQSLVSGTERGNRAFDALRNAESVFVEDIAADAAEWEGSGKGYNTFISTPIVSGDTGYGLLNVDAPETDDLAEDDIKELRVAASFLAIAFAEAQRRTPGPQPQNPEVKSVKIPSHE